MIPVASKRRTDPRQARIAQASAAVGDGDAEHGFGPTTMGADANYGAIPPTRLTV